MAPVLRLGFQDRVTEVRVTSVTSGLEGALGMRLGSVGRAGWTGTPNSEHGDEEREERREGSGTLIKVLLYQQSQPCVVSNSPCTHSFSHTVSLSHIHSHTHSRALTRKQTAAHMPSWVKVRL